ncbi:MAG: hypothetical protein KA161_03995 [Saprospiraceae bacterium]|nr:hypothetical protein [Saprospiraceae bacterium]
MFITLDEESYLTVFKWLYQLRQAGVACDRYPKATKMNKQMKYANDRKILTSPSSAKRKENKTASC